jgi:predicted translin family RNA/ssDNA-binding protein
MLLSNLRIQERDEASRNFYSRLQNPFEPTAHAESNVAAALQHYSEIGESLRGAPDLEELANELIAKRDKAEPHGYFFLIDAPSGTGKTQLPFALKGAYQLNVCHLLLRSGGPTQAIYKTLQSHSELFLQALELDLEILQFADLDSLNLRSSLYTLHTVAFLFRILRPNDQPESSTLSALGDFIASSDKQQLPIFVLDEVLPPLNDFLQRNNDSRAVRILRLARNILRSVGLVVVLMGTNSSAANCIQFATVSRTDEEAQVWCRVIKRLPKQSEDSLGRLGATEIIRTLLQSYQSLSFFLEKQFKTCLPWFVELIVDQIKIDLEQEEQRESAAQFMEKVFQKVSQTVLQRKSLICSDWRGIRGQLCMYPRVCNIQRKRCQRRQEQTNGIELSRW